MNRKNKKFVIDTLLLCVCAAVITTTVIKCNSGTQVLTDMAQKAVMASASLAMPEAGLSVAREYMLSVLTEEEQEQVLSSQPEPITDIPANEQTPQEQEPAEPVFDENDIQTAMEQIPEAQRGIIEQIQFASSGSGADYFSYGNGSLRNATEYTTSEMQSVVDGSMSLAIEKNSALPQVLIVHTHSTESFDRFDAGFYDSEYPTRSTDSEKNIVAVGTVLCDTLNSLGVNTVHATEYHDYPSYTNSYSRSRVTIMDYLAKYPSIKIVLDIHRDGIQREDGTRVKPTVVIGEKKAAQIMIVCGAGDGDSAVPNFRENLKFAARLQNSAQTLYPGFTRPVLFAYRYYNHDLTTGSLVVEVGSESNTLSEEKYAAELLGHALAGVFFEN